MQKIYTRINWKNEPDRTTALNENNLNRIDYAVDALDDRVIGLAGYEERVKESEENVQSYMLAAMQSEAQALEYANRAQEMGDERVALAEEHARMAESYTHGGTGQRENEAVDNAQYYLEQAKQLSQSMNGLIPMGTITYSELSLEQNQVQKYMFNISDDFVTDDTFKEGAGHTIPAGTNVFRTNDGYWDCLAGSFQTPNGDTKDNTVSFVQATTLSNIVSGEKFYVVCGKIAKAINSLITHLSSSVIHITASERSAWNAKQDAAKLFQTYGNADGTISVANSSWGTSSKTVTIPTTGWYFVKCEYEDAINNTTFFCATLTQNSTRISTAGGPVSANSITAYCHNITTIGHFNKGDIIKPQAMCFNSDKATNTVTTKLYYVLLEAD